MPSRRAGADRVFLAIVVALVLGGFFIFTSASLGLLARNGARLNAIAFNQAFFGIAFGAVALFGLSRVPHRLYARFAPHFFVATLCLTALVFIPSFGFAHGGARRWLIVGPFSVQPAEFLKVAFIVVTAAWLAAAGEKVATIRYGAAPVGLLVLLAALVLAPQPDMSSLIIIAVGGAILFIIAGGAWKHAIAACALGAFALAALFFAEPYLRDRLATFVNPARDPLGAGYQIQQSLIAVGSGGLSGRGFGQSVQKFDFLPEPVGDSIFSVAAEEFGFVGSVGLILLFLAFAFRGARIAARAPDRFGGLLVAGIVILVVFQSFANIASLVGILPLTGMPLLFVSHGGSALLATLASVGMVLSVSRYQRPTR